VAAVTALGTCDRCDKAAVVRINETRACFDHLDEVMGETLEPVRAAIDSWEWLGMNR
jgi:hypothetical protein